MPAKVPRRAPELVMLRSVVICSGVGLTQYWSLQGASGPDFRNQSLPSATMVAEGDLVGGVTGLLSWSNSSLTAWIRRRWLCSNVREAGAGLVTVTPGVEVVRLSSKVSVPLGGKVIAKFRLPFALSKTGEVQGVRARGPLVAGSVAIVTAPCFTVSVPSTITGLKLGKWMVKNPRFKWT